MKYNYAAESIEQLYYGVRTIGSEEQRERADELLEKFGNAILADTREEQRWRMLALLANAEWQRSFDPEVKVQKIVQFHENFGDAA